MIVVRALQYLTITRPNITFFVNKVCQFVQAPMSIHLETCKRLLQYLKGTSKHVLFLKSQTKKGLFFMDLHIAIELVILMIEGLAIGIVFSCVQILSLGAQRNN